MDLRWCEDPGRSRAAATRLRRDLDGLAAIGFELRDEIVDDHGFIGRPDDGGPNYPDDDDAEGDTPVVA